MQRAKMFHRSRAVQALILFAFFPAVRSAVAQTRTPLSNATGLYARAIRLSHNPMSASNGNIVVSVTAFPGGSAEADIYNSADGGQTFQQVGAIHDADFGGGLCCGTLYELPAPIGVLSAGTLLWAGSVGQNSTTQPMQIKVYQSSDTGRTWRYLSNCATSAKIGSANGGIWEPEFAVANDGALVCFYSDETQAGHSQLLQQTRTYDGSTWQSPVFTVASNVAADRPGMAVVTKLPSGLFFMTYEMCGPAACTVFYRTSADGWNWGTSSNVGTRVLTTAGQWLEHAPYSTWAPSATSPNGTILLVGQMMYDSNGSVSAGNGITVLANHSADGSGAWTTMPAPVQVPTAYNNYCPNYSSPLLPSADGMTVLELASDYVGSTCTMFYATAPILAGAVTPQMAVSPASPNVVSTQSLPLVFTVSGPAGDPRPTGTLVLKSGSYTSGALALSAGAVSATVPANTFTTGQATLTAAYSGDANYLAATLNVPVTVAMPSFSMTGTNVWLTAGASTGNVSTITLTPANGFTGAVTMSAQIVSGPSSAGNFPTLSFTPSNIVNVAGTTPVTASLTIATTAKTTALLRPSGISGRLGMTALALIAPLWLSRRRRHRAVKTAWSAAIVAWIALGISGCGGSGGSSGTPAPIVNPTPTGAYLITVTGTSASASSSTQVTLTVQ